MFGSGQRGEATSRGIRSVGAPPQPQTRRQCTRPKSLHREEDAVDSTIRVMVNTQRGIDRQPARRLAQSKASGIRQPHPARSLFSQPPDHRSNLLPPGGTVYRASPQRGAFPPIHATRRGKKVATGLSLERCDRSEFYKAHTVKA